MRRSTEELKQLALDVSQGRVFGSWMIRPNDVDSFLMSIFMPLVFGGSEIAETVRKFDVIHFFEYIHKAGPCSMNGYPCFFSVEMLTREETKELQRHLAKLDRMRRIFEDSTDDDGRKEKSPDDNGQELLFGDADVDARESPQES